MLQRPFELQPCNSFDAIHPAVSDPCYVQPMLPRQRLALRVWFSRLPERFWMSVAWRLPRSLAYWATVRMGAEASTGQYSHQVVPEMTFLDVLKRAHG